MYLSTVLKYKVLKYRPSMLTEPRGGSVSKFSEVRGNESLHNSAITAVERTHDIS